MLLALLGLGEGRVGRVGRLALGGCLGGSLLLLRFGNGLGVGLGGCRGLIGGLTGCGCCLHQGLDRSQRVLGLFVLRLSVG